MKAYDKVAALLLGFLLAMILGAVAFVGASCYDPNKPALCDPRCGELPVPGVPYHRFQWEREKLRDAGVDAPEPGIGVDR